MFSDENFIGHERADHTEIIKLFFVRSRIFTIRGVQVMLDRDLAELYGVATKALNQAVKRNIERIPERCMFQLNKDDVANMRSQIVTGTITPSVRWLCIA